MSSAADVTIAVDVDLPQSAAAAVERITTEMVRVQSAVGDFDRVAAGLAALKASHPLDVVIGDIGKPAGMAAAIKARAAWRDPRIAVEKARKAAKAPVLELGRTIDAYAAQIEAELRVGEEHYDRQIKAEEARKAAEKAERERLERERREKFEAGLRSIAHFAVRAAGQPADEIRRMIAELDAMPIAEAEWAEFYNRATIARAETIARLYTMADEAEKREAAEREAAEARRAEQERQRVAAERLAAERAALQAERDRIRAEQEAERRKIEAERAALRAEQEARDRAERERKEAARREQEAQALANKAAAEPEPAPAPKPKASRPTDQQIIEALSLHFRVHELKVVEWLLDMDLEAASERAAAEFGEGAT